MNTAKQFGAATGNLRRLLVAMTENAATLPDVTAERNILEQALPVFSGNRVAPGGLAGVRIAAFGLAGGGVVRRDVDGLVGDRRGRLTDRRIVVDGLARIAFAGLHGDGGDGGADRDRTDDLLN